MKSGAARSRIHQFADRTFGSLIANTDRHFGNLAFFDHCDGKFRLAPIYDMLPMLYAPEHDQLTARTFEPPDPSSSNLREYGRARALAERFWRNCAQDERISEAFRRICAARRPRCEICPVNPLCPKIGVPS